MRAQSCWKRSDRIVTPLLAFILLAGISTAGAQTPDWIWSHGGPASAGETAYFRKELTVGFTPSRAELVAGGDDEITVFLNGTEVARSSDWKKPVRLEITDRVRQGRNVIAIRGKNNVTGAAGVFVRLEIRTENGFGHFHVTDKSWLCTASAATGWEQTVFDTAAWKPATSLGAMGVAPWGNLLGKPTATPAESLTVPPGFKAELLKSADVEEGSWVAMTVDNLGRLIISPEKDAAPMLRITLDPQGHVAKTEPITAPVRGAMGLLYAYDSLYANARGPKGPGLYRLVDANRNDQFEPGEEHLLKALDGDTEHGNHAIVPGPDGMLYVINGNYTKQLSGLAPESPHRNFAEDLLLPRMWDANGHARGILSPGGHILRTDPEGRRWELFCAGFRNAYDMDFSPEGELFTFDSDMEWDIGCPWYRPTRVLHCVNGGEYGWRSGTGKWPASYPDSLPATVDVGLSSPTGVKFGTKSNFPEKYRRAFFIADWNYGKIFATHLAADGASYTGTFETFVSGRPLAVTDIEFGSDGAMYFIIGGWKLQSGLYRVSYVGEHGAAAAHAETAGAKTGPDADAQVLRRRLESFHGHRDPAAIGSAWPHLNSPDRWIRYAARIAIESQEPAQWRQRALDETRVDASLTALLALARCGNSSDQPELLERLRRLAEVHLTGSQSLDALRVLQLCFIRLGRPDAETASAVSEVLNGLYPAPTDALNRELSNLLAYLDAPDIVEKTLPLMSSPTASQEQQMHYAFVLRTVKHGWTPEKRRTYFSWFNQALRDFKGGNSLLPYLRNIRTEAASGLSDAERADLAAILEPPRAFAAPLPPPRPFVREWHLEDIQPDLDSVGGKRSMEHGRQAFAAAQCLACHRLGKDGGAVGPDLTGVSRRFNRHDLLENILLPSKIISDRYQTLTIRTRDGEDASGFLVGETAEKLALIVNPLTGQQTEIAKKDIVSRAVATVSTMPEGLLNSLSKEEILDLLAFIEADGKKAE